MRIGVPTEIKANENRIAIVPAGVEALVTDGHEVFVQRGAGLGSGISDDELIEAGLDPEPPAVWVVAKAGPPPVLAFVHHPGWVPLGAVLDRFGDRRRTSGLLMPQTVTAVR